MQVWILMEGEFGEGGSVEGVFASRELGHGAFAKLAAELHDRFGIRDAEVGEDGSLQLEGGCDWITLKPHDVTGQFEIEA